MELTDLQGADNIIIQIHWSDKKIEFKTEACGRMEKGIYVNPYLNNGRPVELNIKSHSDIQCDVIANDPNTRKRVIWKNVELLTVNVNEITVYSLTTSNFNRLGKDNERRNAERISVRKEGEVWDEINSRNVQIMVYDISDNGLSFYAPHSFIPIGGNQRIYFKDRVKEQVFDIEIVCKIVRAEQKGGLMFFGCMIMEDNKEYLMYYCLKKLMINNGLNSETEEDI